ncbi:MAG: hypothetical protein M1833_005810 [Piccolia ochrophora]|nr:MAG: hypothetical protein M1833_005810 [Piccolia ochrophora]
MHSHVSIILFAVLALVSTSLQLGINCEGQYFCKNIFTKGAEIGELIGHLDGIPDEVFYEDGEQVVCTKQSWHLFFHDTRICAMMHNSRGATVGEMKVWIRRIQDHDCGKCGAVPILPGNNVETGQFKVDYVEGGCDTGICRARSLGPL